MTALVAFAVTLPVLTVLVAALAEPTYADGTPVPRPKQTVHGNLRCLVGGTY